MRKGLSLILLILFLFCGCVQKDVRNESMSLPAMSEVHIICEETPGEDYIDAKITALWDEAAESEPNISNAQAEVKLRGNSSKETVKKAYNVKFEEELAFLGMDTGSKWALVSNPVDKSMLRPVIGFAYAAAMGIEGTPDIRLCQVWLNGSYMGVYIAAEPIESDAGRMEIDPENGDYLLERNLDREEDDKTYIISSQDLRFEVNEPEKPDEAAYECCEELLNKAEEAIISGAHKKYNKCIDVDSFVDFYIFNEVIKDIDFGEFSTRYYFKDGVMYAGPPWDPDLTMGNVSIEKDEEKYWNYNNSILGDDTETINFYGSADGLWAYGKDYYYWLCQDPWFMKKVHKRWEELRKVTENLAVDNPLGISLIDRYLAAYETELAEDFDMYKDQLHMSEWQEPADTYKGNVELLRQWLIKRYAYLDSEFHRYGN